MIYILDACATIAFLRREQGAALVAQCLSDPANECYAHAINLCEVFYDFHRTGGEPTALQVIGDLAFAGVLWREDFSPTLWQAAGRLKSIRRRISLADCFVVALAQSLRGTVLTSDHREFDAVAQYGDCPVTFIR